jgi:hypothetical protein
MARIDGVDHAQVGDESTARVLAAQAKTGGAPLLNHLVYARRPSILRGARGMWAGLEGSGLIDGKLTALLNRRVAALNDKILALGDYASSPLYTDAERVALEYAGSMTLSGREVSDELFGRLRRFYDDDALVELTAIIAWENASSKFNRALRIPSQGLWKRRQ